jgi:hypothetical protein
MIRTKRIARMAKRWQGIVSLGKKHFTWEPALESDEYRASMASKGHCVVYATDGKRFEVPLAYLGRRVFEEYLRMSQEEFGFTSDGGRIILPCDAATMEYAMCLLGRNVPEAVEMAFLSTMAVPFHSASCLATSVGVSQQIAVCSS